MNNNNNTACEIERWVSSIPKELRDLDWWCLWQYKAEGGTKPRKKPMAVKGVKYFGASTTNLDHLTTFQAVIDKYRTLADTSVTGEGADYADGIGFTFFNVNLNGRKLLGLDFDDCILEYHIHKGFVHQIVELLRTYTERSVGRKGIHCIGYVTAECYGQIQDMITAHRAAELATGNRRTGVSKGGGGIKVKDCEAYLHTQYLTVSGDTLEGYTELRDVSHEILCVIRSIIAYRTAETFELDVADLPNTLGCISSTPELNVTPRPAVFEYCYGWKTWIPGLFSKHTDRWALLRYETTAAGATQPMYYSARNISTYAHVDDDHTLSSFEDCWRVYRRALSTITAFDCIVYALRPADQLTQVTFRDCVETTIRITDSDIRKAGFSIVNRTALEVCKTNYVEVDYTGTGCNTYVAGTLDRNPARECGYCIEGLGVSLISSGWCTITGGRNQNGHRAVNGLLSITQVVDILRSDGLIAEHAYTPEHTDYLDKQFEDRTLADLVDNTNLQELFDDVERELELEDIDTRPGNSINPDNTNTNWSNDRYLDWLISKAGKVSTAGVRGLPALRHKNYFVNGVNNYFVDGPGSGGDFSMDDLQEMRHASFWTGKNRRLMDKWYRRGKPYRDNLGDRKTKWDRVYKIDGTSYGERVIALAIKWCFKVYKYNKVDTSAEVVTEFTQSDLVRLNVGTATSNTCRTKYQALHKAFTDWCSGKGYTAVGLVRFGKLLTTHGVVRCSKHGVFIGIEFVVPEVVDTVDPEVPVDLADTGLEGPEVRPVDPEVSNPA